MSERVDRLRYAFANVLLTDAFRYADEKRLSAEHDEVHGVSAVLVLLDYIGDDGDDSEWTVLLSVRSLALRRHPGEVCFPGGMREPDKDSAPVDTALREANEEIGLPSSAVEVVGTLPPVFTRLSIVIYPVLAVLKNDVNGDNTTDVIDSSHPSVERIRCGRLTFRFSAEVDHAFWARLDAFLQRTDRYRFVEIGDRLSMHVFLLERPVFGITSLLAVAVAVGVFDRVPDFLFDGVNATIADKSRSKGGRHFLPEIFARAGHTRLPIDASVLMKISNNLSKL